MLEIELVCHTDTEQARLEDRPTGNKIGECDPGTGGGQMGKRKLLRKRKGQRGEWQLYKHVSYTVHVELYVVYIFS